MPLYLFNTIFLASSLIEVSPHSEEHVKPIRTLLEEQISREDTQLGQENEQSDSDIFEDAIDIE